MIEVKDDDGTVYYGAETMEDCERILREVRDADKIVYDAETSGLDWRHCHTVGHVLTPVGSNSYYVPVRHAGGGNVPGCRVPETEHGWDGSLHPFEKELARVARERPRRWIGHNFAFDLRFLMRVAVILEGVYEDTMINAPLIDENSRFFSLDAVAKYNEVRLKDAGIYEYLAQQFGGEAVKSQMSNWWRTDASAPQVIKYAAGDGYTTSDVWQVQQGDLDKDDLRRVHDVECRLIRTLHRTTSRGIRLDLDELERVQNTFQGEADRLQADLPDWFTNIRAPTQLKRYFAAELDDWPRNPPTSAAINKAREIRDSDPEKADELLKGAPKFDEKALELSSKGRALIEVKKMLHAVSSFTTPMSERHAYQGRVHCEFNQMKGDDYGTVSGRLSSSNPNMQQIPKRNKVISKPYRRVFLPEEGHIWFDHDYSQQEYVVFTNYTKDPNLVEGYMADPPVDIHSMVAKMMGVERDPTAKRMNLGILYGMGKAALAGHLGVSEQQAAAWQREYHTQFPYARPFLKQAEARAKSRGFVKTLLGRRRRFPDRRFAHKAGNAVIQGSSADVTKLKMVEIDEYFESEGDIFGLMLQCHDSLSWTGPESHRYQNEEAIRIMRNFDEGEAIHLQVPIAVDSGEGANWSEATFGA